MISIASNISIWFYSFYLPHRPAMFAMLVTNQLVLWFLVELSVFFDHNLAGHTAAIVTMMFVLTAEKTTV